MVRAKPVTPTGHGEVLTLPPYERWRDMAEEVSAQSGAWTFEICGVTGAQYRAQTRAEILERALLASERMGIPVEHSDGHLLAMTGHQPTLYHPGIWVKDFLLQRFKDESGAMAVDLVVDSDQFDSVAMTTPCMRPGVQVCKDYLAIGGPDRCYACSPVPSRDDLEKFCEAGAEMLSTLPTQALFRHFSSFCEALKDAREKASDLAELVTIARRSYEAPALTDYLELPVTEMAGTSAFRGFFLHVCMRAEPFSAIYNEELASYRQRNGVRTPAQPFPDLEMDGGLVEMPFWVLTNGGRETARIRPSASELVAGDMTVRIASGDEGHRALNEAGVRLAPKALALTMFARLFAADLFIHGVGGARYDEVTDGVIRRFFGVEPPRYAVASMTMYLPLGGHVPSDEELADAKQRLSRLQHNPDQLMGELSFESHEEEAAAIALAEEKSALVEAISRPGADKKALGARIRDVNAKLNSMVEPLVRQAEDQVAALEAAREAADILTDREYPLCLWNPLEVQDKIG